MQPYLHSIETNAIDKGTQILLALKYREWLRNGWTLPTFEEVGFRCFSQTDEDGILLFLFSLIGVTNKRCIEVCAGDGIECCTANLIINHGWKALLFDGSQMNVDNGNAFYARHRDTRIEPPQFVRAWIEAENINDLITSHGLSGEIDLFVLDLNGVDYWVWKSLNCVSPRIVLVEYQPGWGAEKSVSVPYKKDFQTVLPPDVHFSRYYQGASLSAFVKLGKEKGYRLVGCNRYGFNGFFLREDIAPDLLPEVSIQSCLGACRDKVFQQQAEAVLVQYEWVEV